MKTVGSSTIERAFSNIRGAFEIVASLATPWRRRHRTTWGAKPEELLATLPGDELVADPTWNYTHAITLDAVPVSVWPWLVQIGQGRGGLYSFECLENLVGCHIRNTDQILANYQTIAVGDPIRLHPKAPPLYAVIAKPNHHLVLASDLRNPDSTWGFHLVDQPDGSTRLIERGAYRTGSGRVERLTLGPTFLEPVSFVMSRQMLRTIRGLVEQTARQSQLS